MVATGLDGIDTLDPPPLGTVDLAEAKAAWGDKIFFKGNIDSVNTLLNGTLDDVMADARERVKVGMPGGGYILSSACSVAPRVEPEKLMALAVVAQAYGSYPQ
jgi:uroporphyrinogen decarboxylase